MFFLEKNKHLMKNKKVNEELGFYLKFLLVSQFQRVPLSQSFMTCINICSYYIVFIISWTKMFNQAIISETLKNSLNEHFFFIKRWTHYSFLEI